MKKEREGGERGEGGRGREMRDRRGKETWKITGIASSNLDEHWNHIVDIRAWHHVVRRAYSKQI
jgi:hypothetical protein